jgi:elongation factor G
MNRYAVPRIAFINKCDRSGADPNKVVDQLRRKLNHNAVLVQMPIGVEGALSGVVDLVSLKALYFEGPNGEEVRSGEIPAELLEEALARREELLDRASMFSDALTEAVLEDEVSEALIHEALRTGALSRELTPVFVGSAYKNIGIQPLLDGVTRYLPEPGDVENRALDLDHHEKAVPLENNPNMPVVALAFKLEVTPYGQLTYLRIYQGSIGKGDDLVITRTGKKIKVGRVVHMHADEMEDIPRAYAGDIVALFGVDCYSGDTFTDGSLNYSMSSMFVPDPVISLSISAKDNKSQNYMAKALHRFTKEDPTFKSYVDEESGETIISGMGELHLDVYVERMKREFNAQVETGIPQVAYREAITKYATFDYTHKKQTGGAGQFGRVSGYMAPSEDGAYIFDNQVKGGAIPTEYLPAVEKGFRSCLQKGLKLGFPVIGMKVTVNDGKAHSVDSSEMAFSQAAVGAFKQAYMKARPVILEPVMKVSVEGPSEFQGNVMSSINQRRGLIVSSTEDGLFTTIEAEVPLAEMFGYATVLRSVTQGKAEFTMEFSRYQKAPEAVAEELTKNLRDNKKGEKKS